MTVSISDFGFRISDLRRIFRLGVVLCAFCALAGNSFAQIEEPQVSKGYVDNLEKLKIIDLLAKGTVEEKRDALFEIRNRQSEEYSHFAIPALTDSSEIVRATAAFSVIYLPKDYALKFLAPNLQDKAEIVRRETAYALGKIQNPAAINALTQTFQRDKSTEVKNACVVALGEIGDASAVDFLAQILRQKPSEENDFQRRSAARSIGQIAQIIQVRRAYTVTPESFLPEKYKFFTLEKYRNLSLDFEQLRRAVPLLIQILQRTSEADDTRRETAFALGAIGDAAALPALEANVNSKDYYLAEICKESIKKLSGGGLSEKINPISGSRSAGR